MCPLHVRAGFQCHKPVTQAQGITCHERRRSTRNLPLDDEGYPLDPPKRAKLHTVAPVAKLIQQLPAEVEDLMQHCDIFSASSVFHRYVKRTAAEALGTATTTLYRGETSGTSKRATFSQSGNRVTGIARESCRQGGGRKRKLSAEQLLFENLAAHQRMRDLRTERIEEAAVARTRFLEQFKVDFPHGVT